MGGPQLWDCGRQVEPQVPAQVGIRLERVHCWEPFTLQPCPSSQRCPRHQGSQPQHTGTAHPAAVLGPSSGSLCGKVEAANLTQAHAFQVPTWGSWGGLPRGLVPVAANTVCFGWERAALIAC